MPVSQGSMVVGNTLWNSSIILTKYLEDGAEGTAHEFSAAACKGSNRIMCVCFVFEGVIYIYIYI